VGVFASGLADGEDAWGFDEWDTGQRVACSRSIGTDCGELVSGFDVEADAEAVDLSKTRQDPTEGLQAVNAFGVCGWIKLGMINKVIASANDVLGSDYRPFQDFEAFDVDELPSNSDVVFVIAQYLEEIERYCLWR